MLAADRHHHAWCTNGPCAGSISPIIPWSTLQGRSAVRCADAKPRPELRHLRHRRQRSSRPPPAPPPPPAHTPTHTHPAPRTGNAFAKIFVGSRLSCDVSEGISSHCPLQGSNRQPWYLHCTVSPSNHPAESGIPRCGQRSRIANSAPSLFRPSSSGTPSSVVTAVSPRAQPVRPQRRIPVPKDHLRRRPSTGASCQLATRIGSSADRHQRLARANWLHLATSPPLSATREPCARRRLH